MNKFESLNIINNNFNPNSYQLDKFNIYISELYKWNKHTNLVGKTTMINPIKSHLLDCIQVSKYINNSNNAIIDIGSGAGLPGIILSIYNHKNVCLVDSNIKKIKFVKHISAKLNLSLKIIYSRIENIQNAKYDYIISRALAKLDKLLCYSLRLAHKNTKMIFLKGEKYEQEIIEAKKNWKFNFSVKNSLSDNRGKIILLRNLRENA